MPSLEFSRNSKIEPMPWVVPHPGGGNVGYTCHMAAIHWALMTVGMNQAQANQIVGSFARASCPGCTGDGLHSSLSSLEYGQVFCMNARQIPNRNSLHDMVEVGDVLITDNIGRPAHTMIVRQKRGADHITVRGFNNFGTLGTGTHLRYDDTSHNISKDNYWMDPNGGRFGLAGVALFVIRSDDFLSKARGLSKLV